VYADFIEYLRPMTVIGKFGTDGVPALRSVPFRTPLIGQTSGGAGYWVGEGQAKPLTKFDFSRTTLDPLKVANIAVVTKEVVANSSPSADAIIRDQLVAALRERLDLDFINPGKAAVLGVSPASITNGLTPISSTGDPEADVQALFASFIAANLSPASGVFIMSSMTALALSMRKNPLGQREYPELSLTGGTFQGLPVIVTEYVPTDSTGSLLILANASDIYLGDEGGFAVDMSDQASLEMADNPAHNSTTPTPAQLVSLWQTNSVGFRAEREINWAKRRAQAVAYVSGVDYSAQVQS
jgi:HK97 family phage major capsid protein